MPTALMSSTMLSSVKRLSPDMTADLVISTPFGDSFIPVRVLSHHLDSNHGLVAHVIPLTSSPIRGEDRGEGLGEGRGEGLEEQNASLSEGQGEGLDITVRERIFTPISIRRIPLNTPSPEGEGRGEGSVEGKGEAVQL